MKLALLQILGLLALAGCSRHEEPAREPKQVRLPPGVQLATVTAAAAEVEVPGTVRSVTRASLAFKLMGSVKTVRAVLGEPVKAGDVLATLESADLEARLEQARAALDTARRDAARERELAGKGASTPEAARAFEDRERIASASLQEIEASLAYATLRAPFSGSITRRAIEAGDFVSAAQPVIDLEGDGPQEVLVDIPQALAIGLSAGSKVSAFVGEEWIQLIVREIASGVSVSTRTRSLRADLPEKLQLQSGSFVRLRLAAGERTTLVVPVSAVLSQGQLELVFVSQTDGTLERRLIKTGSRRGQFVEVLSGLRAGEQCLADAGVAAKSLGAITP